MTVSDDLQKTEILSTQAKLLQIGQEFFEVKNPFYIRPRSRLITKTVT